MQLQLASEFAFALINGWFVCLNRIWPFFLLVNHDPHIGPQTVVLLHKGLNLIKHLFAAVAE
jgi:hypothetical protein